MGSELTVIEDLRQNDRHSLSMKLMLDDKLYERTSEIAKKMSGATGITPAHLLGKPEACHAVVTRSIMWGLDPYSVAMSTYQVSGKVGFEGKLCHAILERSGAFEGRIKYEMIGDWSKIQGKFKKVPGKTGGEYARADWQEKDEEGLGVTITAKVKGEKEPIIFTFWLKQAFPRNSTLWATDPVTQIKYLAVRRFANSVVPDIFMGVPFDREDSEPVIKDVTPNKENNDEIREILAAQAAENQEVGDGIPAQAKEVEANKSSPATKEPAKPSGIEAKKAEIKALIDNEFTLSGLALLQNEQAQNMKLLPAESFAELEAYFKLRFEQINGLAEEINEGFQQTIKDM